MLIFRLLRHTGFHLLHNREQQQQRSRLQHSPPKRKRSWSRAVFSALQRKGLEKRFEVQKYVTKPDRRQLAAMLGLTDAQVGTLVDLKSWNGIFE